MSKRITLEDDELHLITNLLNHAMSQESTFNVQISDLARVTYDRLATKLTPLPKLTKLKNTPKEVSDE